MAVRPQTPNPDLDAHFADAARWKDELLRLREILLSCPLTEERKWRQPCYTVDGKNVVILSSFSDHCVLGFFKGALLTDPEGVLELPGDNSFIGRQMRFTDLDQIDAREPVIAAYVDEAIAAERAGLTVDTSERPEIAPPSELLAAFEASPEFQTAWDALTPGRRRGYLLHFTGAKKSATRSARIAKHRPRILDGKGMHDR